MNNITIELCAEDRARQDKLAAKLDELIETLRAMKATAATEAPKVETPTETHPAEEDLPWGSGEAETKPQEPEPVKEPEPTVTLAQIQQKVVQLAAGFEGKKKAAVREIVNAYAPKVSDLPEDKWPEIWEKLIALENGG